MKKILFIIAFEGFQDYELSIPLKLLTENNYKTIIASNNKGNATGKYGMKIKVDLQLSEINTIQEYEAVLFIGGPGMIKLLGNQYIDKIAKEAVKEKIIGAICIAPLIIAKTGILQDKNVTVWNDNNQTAKLIEQYGAVFVDQDIITDDNIITANGPNSAEKFAKAILKKLKEK